MPLKILLWFNAKNICLFPVLRICEFVQTILFGKKNAQKISIKLGLAPPPTSYWTFLAYGAFFIEVFRNRFKRTQLSEAFREKKKLLIMKWGGGADVCNRFVRIYWKVGLFYTNRWFEKIDLKIVGPYRHTISTIIIHVLC